MSLRSATHQVPANTLGVGDVCEFGTIERVDDQEGGTGLILVTENGEIPVSESKLVWISHQAL